MQTATNRSCRKVDPTHTQLPTGRVQIQWHSDSANGMAGSRSAAGGKPEQDSPLTERFRVTSFDFSFPWCLRILCSRTWMKGARSSSVIHGARCTSPASSSFLTRRCPPTASGTSVKFIAVGKLQHA